MDHITEFIGAYLDGELRASQVASIEKHMETCELCRQELAELTALSHMLRDTAPVRTLKAEDQFVAEVGLLLPRKAEVSALERTLTTGWKAIPVGLAATWIFVQTSLIVMTCVYIISLVAPGTGAIDLILTSPAPSAWANSLGWVTQPFLIQILEVLLQSLRLDGQIYWQILSVLIVPLVLGVLFVCWLASWWVVRERSMNTKSV